MKDKYHYKDGNVLEYYDYDRGLHRIDGPAIECNDGSKYWYINGKRHRVDGPAIEWADGYKAWYIDGKKITEEDFNMHPKVEHYRFQLLLEEILSEE